MSDPIAGKPLPRIALEATGEKNIRLPDELLGKWTVLYTYPKDDTPGCTKEACIFRDNLEHFEKLGVQVLGVSPDSLESHREFAEKHRLNFPLLADVANELSEALGSYGDQEWQGRTFKGVSRDTFLIDPAGVIQVAWRRVDPVGTMAEVWEELQRRI